MTTSWGETEALRDIVEGLGAAIAEEKSWEKEQLDPIKFNKLLFLAVRDFELPITYQWYRYGADFTRQGVHIDELAPRPLSEMPSPDEPRVSEAEFTSGDGLPSPADAKEFYLRNRDDIDQLFGEDTKEFLRSFYKDYAPEDLEEVYTACAVFQVSMDSIGHADEPGEAKAFIEEHIDTLLDELKTLKVAVMRSEIISDVDERFFDYTDLLEDVLVTVADRDDELEATEERALESVVRFFYNEAWQLVALKIAVQETHGTNALEWRETSVVRFQQAVNEYDQNLSGLVDRCKRNDLIADELLEYHEPLIRPADGRNVSEAEERGFEEWKHTSDEAGPYL
jgi:Fe-S-cluster formation regulator IscX/YfhJ